MTPPILLACIIIGAVVMYCLLAGADFGAGFWDLVCSGPRTEQQHELIENAIEPVWETNHVWLILVVVLMFVGFPSAFSAISIGLAVPVFLVLLGIILRGSSYIFRAYFTGKVKTQLYWGKLFSIASCATPLFLGIVIGAISTNTMVLTNGVPDRGWLGTWFHPFPVLVGMLSLFLFAYLSACYLTLEAEELELQEDFRRRALFSGFVSLLAAFATYAAAGTFAPGILEGLSRAPYVWLVEVVAAVASLVAFQGLWVRSYRRARIGAAVQVGSIVVGWGVAQFPYLVRPTLTIAIAAAPINILVDVEVACAVGAILLLPSLYLLFSIFKAHRQSIRTDGTIV